MAAAKKRGKGVSVPKDDTKQFSFGAHWKKYHAIQDIQGLEVVQSVRGLTTVAGAMFNGPCHGGLYFFT